jgi:hypothetical protein
MINNYHTKYDMGSTSPSMNGRQRYSTELKAYVMKAVDNNAASRILRVFRQIPHSLAVSSADRPLLQPIRNLAPLLAHDRAHTDNRSSTRQLLIPPRHASTHRSGTRLAMHKLSYVWGMRWILADPANSPVITRLRRM